MSTITDIGTLISCNPDIHDGCPIIAGTSVTVGRIAIWYKQGFAAEEIADRIGYLTLTQVYAALTYYHANRAEIDAEIAAKAAEAERIEALISEDQIQKLPTNIALEIPTIANYSSRREFMQLPLEERRNILAKQADVMLQHYQEDKEWQELEGGDLIDY
ncbi:DUF433 domain-containing protein [Symplocastrum sp. BBK-W-15]|uniref:DUF433 domain-containing protein n=1 Tax=Limnofasciculus baicalensis BBK-W-15 TaxID=2699891 RepID=A0AAE3GPC0_9CYAN|nr:DUF433 domain-containing protein [Limnofasciculus baicalensis]MCP2727448.1 DUF433 domain-containing protein [Limnofasciculus baicalensis BBK-W-15]